MSDLQLSPEERRVVALFAAMPRDAKVRAPIWFIEIVVPLALAIGGWLANYNVLVAAAIGGLIATNAHRMFRQFSFARDLQSICSKVQAVLPAQPADGA